MGNAREQFALPRHTFFVAVVLTEVTLLVFFSAWYLLTGYYVSPTPTGWELYMGVITALPIIAANGLLLSVFKIRSYLPSTFSFIDNIVYPLCRSIGVGKILIISVLAAFAEELFFRLALQSYLRTALSSVLLETNISLWMGVFISAFVYAYLHFGNTSSHYRFLALCYFLIALYFGALTVRFTTIWPAILAHGFFNFFTMFYVKYFYSPDERSSPAT